MNIYIQDLLNLEYFYIYMYDQWKPISNENTNNLPIVYIFVYQSASFSFLAVSRCVYSYHTKDP